VNIKAAICSYLRNEGAITVLVGTKVYQSHAPRNAALPYIIVDRISANRPRHMLAGSPNVNPSVQISCYADDPGEADTIADAVRLKMHGLLDWKIGHDANRILIKSATLESEIDLYDYPADGSNVGADSVRQTWSIWHTETVPTFP